MNKSSLHNIRKGEALRLALRDKQESIFAYISAQQAANPSLWEARVNSFILAHGTGGRLLPNGWIVNAQGHNLYPVGSMRWQWEEEALAARELGI